MNEQESHFFANSSPAVKRLRRELVCTRATTPLIEIAGDRLLQLLPHRPPFLLLDKITGVDFEDNSLIGERYIEKDDPVFAGHFPALPVYPGMLLVETMGQLGCVFCSLETHGTLEFASDVQPTLVRATKVLGAEFFYPVFPGQHLTILGKRIQWDGLIAQFAGQVLVDGKICCTSIGELYVG